ncbi:MAG TPA: hypothetical protein VHZ96_26500 [Frankiaceae bacterium]|jgi:hypothetical protein|nr:hypothetical protein [Frankiaceae bacterium]
MITTTADVTAVIEGRARRFGAVLTIDLPASDYVDFTRALAAVSFTDQMTTDLPDAARMQDGISTLTGDVTLGGSVDPHGDATKTAAWLFNPDSPDSPLRHLTVNGSKITYEEGPYVPGSKDPWLLPVSGDCYVNGYDLDFAAGTVVLHVTNLPPDWDAIPSVPAVATLPPFNAGLTSEFVMDAVIRDMHGDSTWPKTRDQCVLAVGFRSSAWAEVGQLDTGPASLPQSFAPGIWGTGLRGIDAGGLAYRGDSPLGDDAYLEMAFTADADLGSGDFALSVGEPSEDNFNISPTGGAGGHLELLLNTADSADQATYTFPVGLTSGVHKFALQVHWPTSSTSWSATLTLDGTAYSSGTQSIAGARSTTMSISEPDIGSAVVFEAFQVTGEGPDAVPSWPFTPLAILDPSLNPLTVCPAIDADSKGWDVLTTMAGAELGYIRKDRQGVIRFSNRQTIAGAPVARTIGETSLLGFGTTVPPAGAYRTITVPYTEWDFTDDPTAIFTLKAKKKIPAGQTVTWQQPLTDGTVAAAIDTTFTLLPDGHDPTDGGSYYRSSADVHGIAAGPKLTVTGRLANSGLIEITAANKSRTDAYLTTPSTNTDLPAGTQSTGLWVGGYTASPGDEATVVRTYGDGVGTLPVDSNPYLQDHDTAVAVGDWLLGQLFTDVRDFTDVAIMPDHRLDIADPCRLTNPDPSGVDEYVLLWGRTYAAQFPPAGQQGGSRSMTLDVRAFGPPDAPLGGQIPDRAEADLFWAYS